MGSADEVFERYYFHGRILSAGASIAPGQVQKYQCHANNPQIAISLISIHIGRALNKNIMVRTWTLHSKVWYGCGRLGKDRHLTLEI